ncbi:MULTISPECIES: hypothetical protein [Oscillibacter]|uniref:hypothetical protein n=1 Tax=Oscillibacter TaxID=459786 RepID=UPI0028970059|nr:hypothetical protein [Oscillibacter sp.]
MPFKPGQSGNAKGRPKQSAEQKQQKERFLSLLRASTVPAIKSIIEIASDSGNRDCLAAAKYLVDKAYGVNVAFLMDNSEVEPLTIHIVRDGQEKKVQDDDDGWD